MIAALCPLFIAFRPSLFLFITHYSLLIIHYSLMALCRRGEIIDQ